MWLQYDTLIKKSRLLVSQWSHNETTGPLREITVEGQELTLPAEESPLDVYWRVELVAIPIYIAASYQSPGKKDSPFPDVGCL